MYPKYFGLSEPSFSITPDPQYLFLSEQHREALAHLLYGAGETGGFVLLTGEVGTGKTTVCRAFLEQLPREVEVALVLNPALTSLELMAAVCEEFGVQVPSGERSTKALLDRVNRYLLQCHAEGRRPVLIIDEAQNLRPVVLEQIRLLTNLETTKHKLLQIFLIGQPELRTLLSRDELRQLNQRITARFHLVPLQPAETAAYIRHRLSVAGVDRPLFTRAAVRRVHRHSGGVPRLINLICDRALLGAAVSHRLLATAAIVDRAAREVRGGNQSQPWPRRGLLGLIGSALVAGMVGLGIGVSGVLSLPQGLGTAPSGDREQPLAQPLDSAEAAPTEDGRLRPPEPADSPQELSADAAVDAPPLSEEATAVEEETLDESGAPTLAQRGEDGAGSPSVAEVEDLPEQPVAPEPLARQAAATALPPRLSSMASAGIEAVQKVPLDELVAEPAEALASLLSVWRAPGDSVADCQQLSGLGLACEAGEGRWSDLRHFDRPAALRLELPGGRQGEIVLVGLDDEFARLSRGPGEPEVTLPIAEIDQRWSGHYRLLWRLPPSGDAVIGRTADGAAVHWLRDRLRAWPAGDPDLSDGDDYDAELMEQVRRFQAANQLKVDGIAGPHTLILLANALAAAAGSQAVEPGD